jgi:hypothetical protein
LLPLFPVTSPRVSGSASPSSWIKNNCNKCHF